MRVVAGTAGGLRLSGPNGGAVRPTTDKVREAIFNSLASLGVVEGSRVLDLFAGTGACGIEALSRGAVSATFVDHDRKSVRIIRDNLSATNFEGQVVTGDAISFLAGADEYDVVFADPPYVFDKWDELLTAIKAPIVVCESDREISPSDGWSLVRARKYGDTTVTILERDQ